VQASLGMISAQFAAQFAKQTAAQSGSSLVQLLSSAPQIIINPLGYTIENLRPFDIPV
jgi:ABC-type phosphate transport system permease subunit